MHYALSLGIKYATLNQTKKTDLLQQYTILNLGIGFVVPPLVYFISRFYPELFYNRGVIWFSFILAVFVIIWMLLNVAKASNSRHIRLPGLILWGIASPLCSIFLFAAVYFGATSHHNLSFVHALEFSFSAFIRRTSGYSDICQCELFEITQNYLGYLLFAYVIAVTIQGINIRMKDEQG